jgi:TATA-binding protein-associated factor Taf7
VLDRAADADAAGRAALRRGALDDELDADLAIEAALDSDEPDDADEADLVAEDAADEDAEFDEDEESDDEPEVRTRSRHEVAADDASEIEDSIRDCEREQEFGPRFVELARSVYRTNDRRAALKRQINELLGSRLVEEKSYAAY